MVIKKFIDLQSKTKYTSLKKLPQQKWLIAKQQKKLKPNKQTLPKTNNPTLLKILNKIILFLPNSKRTQKTSMTKQ